jgi:photosystem II stability/assembly factor-like uncharacterized protein
LGRIAVSDSFLGMTTKENGIFIFDFQKQSWINISNDEQIIKNNLEELAFHKSKIYVGTQYGGIFVSTDQGKSWSSFNVGLGNLTIRRFVTIENKLYVGTNGGLYSLNEGEKKWDSEYEQNSLQVNGITEFGNEIYIGTNQGAFKTLKQQKNWKQVITNQSLHNISSDDKTVYAMVYNELFASIDKGESWLSIQKGLPAKLYSFQVIKNENTVLVGQWDGVYRKDFTNEEWKFSSRGLPIKTSITNMKIYKGIIIAGCSVRKLRAGMTTDK